MQAGDRVRVSRTRGMWSREPGQIGQTGVVVRARQNRGRSFVEVRPLDGRITGTAYGWPPRDGHRHSRERIEGSVRHNERTRTCPRDVGAAERGQELASNAMKQIVDGNNAMGARPDGWWRDRPAAMRRLVEDLGAREELRGATVVFDGRGRDRRVGGVDVAHAHPLSADDWIVRRAAAASERVRVWTSDAALRARVEAYGHETRGAGALVGRGRSR